jgi:hypothetical protein
MFRGSILRSSSIKREIFFKEIGLRIFSRYSKESISNLVIGGNIVSKELGKVTNSRSCYMRY